MIAVFGSGFGLYGHLPALVELGRDVQVPARYRSAFDERAELNEYRSAVHFTDDETTLLSKSDLAVLARRPADNDALARQALLLRCPLQLVIEKPPSPTPESALSLDGALSATGIRYATPYLLTYCEWARDCRLRLDSRDASEIRLDWCFRTSIATGSWKTVPDLGGGTVNYYAIHLIALAGYLLGEHHLIECVAGDDDSGSKIKIVASNGSARMVAAFRTTSSTDSSFSVTVDGTATLLAASPFGSVPSRGYRDPRIEVLKSFYAAEVFAVTPNRYAEDLGVRILNGWAELTRRLQTERRHCNQTLQHSSSHPS